MIINQAHDDFLLFLRWIYRFYSRFFKSISVDTALTGTVSRQHPGCPNAHVKQKLRSFTRHMQHRYAYVFTDAVIEVVSSIACHYKDIRAGVFEAFSAFFHLRPRISPTVEYRSGPVCYPRIAVYKNGNVVLVAGRNCIIKYLFSQIVCGQRSHSTDYSYRFIIIHYSAILSANQIISVSILIKNMTSTVIISGLTAFAPFFSKNVTPM